MWSQLVPGLHALVRSDLGPDPLARPRHRAPPSQGAGTWQDLKRWAGNPASSHPAPRSPNAPVTLPCVSPQPPGGPVPAQAWHKCVPRVSVVSRNEGPCACPAPVVRCSRFLVRIWGRLCLGQPTLCLWCCPWGPAVTGLQSSGQGRGFSLGAPPTELPHLGGEKGAAHASGLPCGSGTEDRGRETHSFRAQPPTSHPMPS